MARIPKSRGMPEFGGAVAEVSASRHRTSNSGPASRGPCAPCVAFAAPICFAEALTRLPRPGRQLRRCAK
eukprot:scaffold1696_cov258-Pinguiococcus_pyrenoidosus.AAC.34